MTKHETAARGPGRWNNGLQQMLGSMGDHIRLLDENLNILWTNENAQELFGHWLIGRKCYEAYHGRDAPCEPQPCIVAKAFNDGQAHHHEVEVTDQQGHKRFFHCTASGALYDESGRVFIVIEVSRDITHQGSVKRALRAEREELELLVHQRTAQLMHANHQLMLEVEEHKQTELDLGHRQAIIEAVHFCALKFLKTDLNDSVFQEALTFLGNAVEAGKVYIQRKDTGRNGALLTGQLYEWMPSKSGSQTNIPTSARLPLPADLVGRWADRMAQGNAIIGRLREFPLDEQRLLAPLGIRSIILTPIFLEDSWWGFLGFDDRRQERTWSDAEIKAIRTAADMIGAAVEHRRRHNELVSAETRYRQLVEHSPDLIAIIIDGRFRFINDAGVDLLGASSPAQIIGEPALKFFHPPDSNAPSRHLKRLLHGREIVSLSEQKITRLDGHQLEVELASLPFPEEGSGATQLVVRDLTWQKLGGAALGRREHNPEEQARHLEEAKAAIKALTNQREQDNKEFAESISHNVRQIILPHLERLGKRGLNAEQAGCVEALKASIEQLVSPFIKVLSVGFSSLTPTEIQIAHMVRRGCRTKEVSEVLGIAETTVLFHRQNIRNKLGLKGSKVNLQSHLRSIE